MEEILAMLSNLGAIDEKKAVTREVLKNSDKLKDPGVDDEIASLVETGYIREADGRLYLTQSGLFRALSRFS